MSGIGFAVRGADGVVVRGQAIDGTVEARHAQELSLNLSPEEVKVISRRGGDLVIQTQDGEIVVLEGYFQGPLSDERELFLSKSGQLHKVDLDDDGGQLVASFDAIPLTEKWSQYDELTFLNLERVEPVVAPIGGPVIGGLGSLLGIGGAAAVASTIVPGGDSGPATPTVDDVDVDRIIGGTGPSDVVVTGTGEPGSDVIVEIGGETVTTTIDDDGTWTATFLGADLPDDGVYQTTVTVTDPSGDVHDLTGPTVDIDTTAPDVAVQSGTQSTSDIVNAVEHNDGPVITGTGEPGANVSVEINGATHSTTVLDDGSWSVIFDASEITTGEYETAVTITTTDARGNVNVVSDVLVVDTVAPDVDLGVTAGDDVINANEAAAGVQLNGFGEAGTTLSVTFQGLTREVTVGADGNWSLAYDASQIAPGTYDSAVVITATDVAGNSSTETFTVHVDTEGGVTFSTPVAGDNIVNQSELSAGFAVNGTAEPNAEVQITLHGVTHTVTADASGNWTTTYLASEIPQGDYEAQVSVTSTDAAGNVSTTSGTIHVDTETSVGIDATQVGDNTINAGEQGSGFALTGTAEAGSQVQVTLEGVTHTVTAGADGTWVANFAANEIRQGTYDTTVTVVSTDTAGNVASSSSSLHVDTEIAVGLDAGQAGGDDIANADDVAGGVTLTGTSEPGAEVVVTLAGVARTVTAGGDGSWAATFTAADIAQGEYDAPVSVVATDAAGNVASTSGTLHVDTSTQIDIDVTASGFAGGTVNAEQIQSGLVLTGTSEPGANIVITVDGIVRTTTVDSNGNWSVTYEPGSLPEGTYEATATLQVTDLAGNTATSSTTFLVDTEITNPVVQSVTFSDDDVTSVSLLTGSEEDYSITALNGDGSSSALATTEVPLAGDESLFVLNPAASDGTHLVVSAEDGAGNKSDTLLVLDDNMTNAGTLDHAGLDAFNIEGIELDYASDTSLTLTEAQIKELSDTSDSLTIHGGSDDQVNVSGAVKTGQTVDIEGEAYDVYTVGDDGVTLIVDQDINVVI